jgi:adenosylhomocysteinase
MEDNLAVLNGMVEQAPEQEAELVVIFHLLPDTERFLDRISEVFAIDRIIGVPYSSRHSVAKELREHHDAEVTIPEDVEDVQAQARDYIEKYVDRNPNRDLLILDVGGHCASFIDEIDTSSLIGIIEDTNQGHWRYEETDPPVPVYSIAQARLKNLENRTVGEAVTFSLENIIRNEFEQELNGKRVLVLGYGNIGQSVATACRGRSAEVMVYDIDSVKKISARLEGHTVKDREQMLEEAQIIIGTSGQCSITSEDLDHLSGETILASGTSKQVEIDVDGLVERATLVEEDDLWQKFELDGNGITLLNEGYPINFLDNSISLAMLDLIFPALFGGMLLLTEGNEEPQIHEPDENLTQEIASTWLEVY